jgi:hypothetical protein
VVTRGKYINSHFLFTFLPTSFTREHNQLGLVLIQSLHIQLQTLLVGIASPVIHCNTQLLSLLDVETRLLEFFKSESSTLADFNVVPQAGTTDGRTKKSGWTWSKGCSTFCTSEATTLLSCWLVKPSSDSALPVLWKWLAKAKNGKMKGNKPF